MEMSNKTMVQLFAEKAKLDAEIRKIRVKRIFLHVNSQKKSHDKIQLEKKVESLNKELGKIQRCYIIIDDLIDELECKLDLGEE